MAASSPEEGRLWSSIFVLLMSSALLTSCLREAPYDDVEDLQDFLSVTAIQTPHGDDEPPRLGEEVSLRSVIVTAYDSYAEIRQSVVERDGQTYCLQEVGYTGGVVVQEGEGGPFSGVSLFNPALVPSHATIGPGDLVDVEGEYLEFCLSGDAYVADSYCDAENTNRLTQLGGATVIKVGEAQPLDPVVVSLTNLGNENSAEPYEGVLVRLDEALDVFPCEDPDGTQCCVGDYDRNGNLCLGSRDGRYCGGIELTNEFYALPIGTSCVTSVTGIVTWFGHASEWGDYRISPRGPDDVVIPDECRQ